MNVLEALKILELEEEDYIDASILKSQFRKLTLIHHPDKGGLNENFRKIKDAYEFLANNLKNKKRIFNKRYKRKIDYSKYIIFKFSVWKRECVNEDNNDEEMPWHTKKEKKKEYTGKFVDMPWLPVDEDPEVIMTRAYKDIIEKSKNIDLKLILRELKSYVEKLINFMMKDYEAINYYYGLQMQTFKIVGKLKQDSILRECICEYYNRDFKLHIENSQMFNLRNLCLNLMLEDIRPLIKQPLLYIPNEFTFENEARKKRQNDEEYIFEIDELKMPILKNRSQVEKYYKEWKEKQK